MLRPLVARFALLALLSHAAALASVTLASPAAADTVRDRSGSSVGRIDPDGTVRDRSGSTLGKVERDGTVRDRSGSTLGSGGTTRLAWVAVRFFFWSTLL